MKFRQKLGQHFLTSHNVAQKIITSAKISLDDRVLEIGPGHGILTSYLCEKSNHVKSIESDQNLFSLLEKKNFPNSLTLEHGDGFLTDYEFDILVSNLPYSESRRAIEWLSQKKFKRAVIMIQKEFSEKLFATGNDKKAISIIAQNAFEITPLFDVSKLNFSPIPKVESTVNLIIPKKKVNKNQIKIINKMFSYRRKTLQNVLSNFGISTKSTKRLEELSAKEIMDYAKQIS